VRQVITTDSLREQFCRLPFPLVLAGQGWTSWHTSGLCVQVRDGAKFVRFLKPKTFTLQPLKTPKNP
jgi:hypothetical protein